MTKKIGKIPLKIIKRLKCEVKTFETGKSIRVPYD